MNTNDRIKQFSDDFVQIYIRGIPFLINDDGAYLSFICTLIGIEVLGGFLTSDGENRLRFKKFIESYFPGPYRSHVDNLWKLRNAAVHGFSTVPFTLTHHNNHLHLTQKGEVTYLNADDLFAVFESACRRYLDDLASNPALQAAFVRRAGDVSTKVLKVTTNTTAS